MAKIRTHYDNLRVARNAPDSVIKAAYKALCQTYHPDKYQGDNAEAERIMKIINTSYSVLIDPIKRAEHDAWIRENEAATNQQHEKATFDEAGEATDQTYQKQETKREYTPPPTEPEPPKNNFTLQNLYEVAIGEKNLAYYLSIFQQFDQQPTEIKASWNWSAFLFSNAWLLYRKMYGWFFASLGIAIIAEIIIDLNLFSVLPMFFGISANSLYHDSIKKKIATAQQRFEDEQQILEFLRSKSGVNTWVAWVFGSLPVMGIIASIVIPALQDHKVTAPTLAVQSNQQATPQDMIQRAEQGDANAQYNLGRMYAKGQGVTQDYTQAIAWYRKAAEQGLADAQFNLGVAYTMGQGVTQDDAQAVVWFRKASEQGDVGAQSNLGFMYEHGRGVVKDETQAVVWYRKAAEQGDAVAQFNLGNMYDKGQVVTQDYAQAVIWYRKAAEQGLLQAQYNLGVAYDQGRGVVKDETQAVVWFRKAAEQGNEEAQFNLAAMYARGQGVEKDEAQALAWLRKAAAQGHQQAQELLRKYAQPQSETQTVKADSGCIGNCINGYGSFTYANGNKYEGEWKNNKPDGKGTMIYPNDSKYTGEWKNGKREGKGSMSFKNDLVVINRIWKNDKEFKDGYYVHK